MMKNILNFAKQLLLENLKQDSIVVDATLGNGNDSLFLCEHFKYVYGFDVQKEAIEASRQKLENYSNYQLILDSHENVENYVDKCDGAIFNLGYLPNSNSDVTTNAKTTILAIKSLLNIIECGIIVLVVYVGHDDALEALEVEEFVKSLDNSKQVLKYQFINREKPPYILAIKI